MTESSWAGAQRQADRIEAMLTKPAPTMTGAPVVEIVEYVDEVDDGPYGVPVTNDVLINGVSVLCSDDPVIVHEISTSSHDVVRVTITLLARRVVIEQRKRPA